MTTMELLTNTKSHDDEPRVCTSEDVHLGSMIRQARALRGITQEVLGGHLGITFQQIQKYENGTNRVSAVRMAHIARFLDMPVKYFLPNEEGVDVTSRSDAFFSRQALTIAKIADELPAAQRAALLGVARSLKAVREDKERGA